MTLIKSNINIVLCVELVQLTMSTGMKVPRSLHQHELNLLMVQRYDSYHGLLLYFIFTHTENSQRETRLDGMGSSCNLIYVILAWYSCKQ